MKETENFHTKVQQLLRLYKRKAKKLERPDYEEPVDAVVFAVLSEHTTSQQAQTAFKRLKEYFIDLNDLRVSRPEEIVEAAGSDTGIGSEDALRVISVLKAIFDKYNLMTLADIKRQGKKQIRETISRFPGMSDFVADYTMLTAFEAHAVPLTENMVENLRSKKIVPPETAAEQLSLMLARHIPAKDGYAFYASLRKESERITGKKKHKHRQAANWPKAEKTDTAHKNSGENKAAEEKIKSAD